MDIGKITTKISKPAQWQMPVLNEIKKPLWLSVSEAARFGGVTQKTVRRALETGLIRFKVEKNRYLIELGGLVKFLCHTPKRQNKFKQNGLGQYVKEWKN